MQLLIYGSGGLGRELCELAERINKMEHTWERILFVDDIRKERNCYGIDVLRFEEALKIKHDSECIIGLGEPLERMHLYNKCKENGFRFTKLIDPLACVSESVTIGEGSIVRCFSSIVGGAWIGENVVIQPMVTIGHDTQIGAHTVLSVKTSLGGGVIIDERTYVGMGVNILERLHVGNDTIVSMGSNVYKDIEDGMIVMGNPARVIRRNENHHVFK